MEGVSGERENRSASVKCLFSFPLFWVVATILYIITLLQYFSTYTKVDVDNTLFISIFSLDLV